MNVSIRPDLQEFVEQKVRTGQYPTPEDVINAGLATLKQQEAFGDFAPGELDELIAEGEKSIEQHGTLDGDEAFQSRRQRRSDMRGADE